MKRRLRSLAQRFLSVSTRRKIIRYTRWPPVGLIRFGSLRRLKPISSDWGMERGRPIDRYYIERFLAQNAENIQGQVLEVGDNTYTCQFGQERVSKSIVMHVAEQREKITLIGDLTDRNSIPKDRFDCVIVTQTLQTIFDVQTAVDTIYYSLKPGGVALITIPGISKISRYDMERWGYYWSFTTRSAEALFSAVFPPENINVEAHGNVLTAIAFLHGAATEELSKKELDYCDPDYEVLITVKAIKPFSV